MKLVVYATALFLMCGLQSSVAQESTMASGTNTFGVDLYRKLAERPGNLFFSPASISTAFGMAYAGAKGQTAQETAKVFRFDPSPRQVGAQTARLLKQWNAPGEDRGYQLAVANALWGQQGYPFLPAFTTQLQTDWGADLHTVNFKQTEAARETINQWVEKQTQDKIKDLIPSGGIDASVRMVLTNAVYFKAAWDEQFQPRATQPAAFNLADGKTVQVPMMHQMAIFAYLKGDGFAALGMNYARGKLSMIVFLPDKADGLGEFEKSLSDQKLAGWIDGLRKGRSTEVRVSFPKFKMTEELQLSRELSKMGMSHAFGPGADFSAMNGGGEPLSLGEAFHKAYVDLNEEGTEAAAATAIGIRATAMPALGATFTADHPFFFVIRDNESGTILFIGRVVNPIS
jgi:serpin B